jgi:Legionella pneumophila major outer membrane protein precursor
MVGTARVLLLVAFLGCLPPPCIVAQAPNLPGQPVPVAPPQPGNPVPPIPVPRVDAGPAPAPALAPAPVNPPFATPIAPYPADPIFAPAVPNTALAAQCGYYGLFEISVLFPNVSGTLSGPVTVTGMPPTTVSLGSANLDTVGSPRVEVGYRLSDGIGAVAVAYRSIVSKGGENAPEFGQFGNPFLSSLLNVNVVDIDYVSPAYNVMPCWNFSWRGGIRVAAVYDQNQLVGTLGQQEAASNFVGAGPHAELEIGRSLPVPGLVGLAALAKLDGAVLVGNTSQSFSESLQNNPTVGGASVFNRTTTVPVLTFDIGVSYAPLDCNWARFGLGYQFEYWWDIGKGGGSTGNLMTNGIYFRGEFNF